MGAWVLGVRRIGVRVWGYEYMDICMYGVVLCVWLYGCKSVTECVCKWVSVWVYGCMGVGGCGTRCMGVWGYPCMRV